MHIAIEVVALVAVVAAGAALARRLGISAPLLLVIIGVAASYLPFVPRVELEPEVVLVGFLPPLLYAAAIRTSLVDFTKHRRSIGLLSVGLVVFTARRRRPGRLVAARRGGRGLGYEPLPFWAAFAIGAVVAPPDAVAATAIARRVGLPRRVVTILEGESLVNDATALVCLRTAIARRGGHADGPRGRPRLPPGGRRRGRWSAWSSRSCWPRSAGGSPTRCSTPRSPDRAVHRLHRGREPYVHASGVLAVVVTGLLLGHKAPIIQSAKSRMSERTNWRTFQFLLENTVFLLIGLQTRWILDDLAESPLPGWLIAAATIAVFAAVVAAPADLARSRRRSCPGGSSGRSRPGPVSWQSLIVVSWAGCAAWSRWPPCSCCPRTPRIARCWCSSRWPSPRARCCCRARPCPGWYGDCGCPGRTRRRMRCRRPPYCRRASRPAIEKLDEIVDAGRPAGGDQRAPAAR